MDWRCGTATNLAIDDELICAARKLGGHRTKKDAVNAALEEYVRRKRLEDLFAMFGTVEYVDGYDIKRERMLKNDRLARQVDDEPD